MKDEFIQKEKITNKEEDNLDANNIFVIKSEIPIENNKLVSLSPKTNFLAMKIDPQNKSSYKSLNSNYNNHQEQMNKKPNNYFIINDPNSNSNNNLVSDVLTLNQNKNIRSSIVYSRKQSSNILEIANFVPSSLLNGRLIKIPALKGQMDNSSVSEEDDDSDETVKDTSFFEEVSILYTNKNQEINDKYSYVVAELNRISDMNFNVFNLSIHSNNFELFFLMNHLFSLYNFEQSLKIKKQNFRNYFCSINENYRKNQYHNSIHGCDVTQTMYFLIKTCNIDSICNLNDLDFFSIFFASAIHDVDHPGNNNNWEIAIRSSLALSYNDKAVLENYHLCKAFSLLKKHDCDVFSNFTLIEYNQSRGMIINMVLTTDMANHFPDLATLKLRSKNDDFNPLGADKQFLLNQLIHASDISNPLKPIEIYKEWVQRVFREFFNQGDKEKEKHLKVSFLCDRNTVNVIEAQIGFIEGIVFPLFEALSVPFPNMKMINNLILNNKEEFKKMKEKNFTLHI